MDLSEYPYNKIIHGKVLYVYHIFKMDDWNRTRFIDTLEETPEGVWLVSIEPIDKLKEYDKVGVNKYINKVLDLNIIDILNPRI